MTGAVAAASAAQANQASRATLSQNFDTFLTLLTAQLQNQDPLDPVDSAQFTQQLVQYSGVEQQIRTNEQLQTMLAQQSASAGGAALGYLGKTAVFSASNVALGAEGGAEWSYSLPEAARETRLVVRDASGRVARTIAGETARGDHTVSWNGEDANSRRLPAGVYTLSVEAAKPGGETIPAAVTVRERITSVEFGSSGPVLTTAAGARDWAQILRISETN